MLPINSVVISVFIKVGCDVLPDGTLVIKGWGLLIKQSLVLKYLHLQKIKGLQSLLNILSF